MKLRKFFVVGLLLTACGGEEPAAGPVAPIAPGTPSAAVPGLPAQPGQAVPGVAAPAVPNAAAAQTRSGILGPGDQTLETGEYAESFTFTWNAGESHDVRVSSSVFDPYVIVKPPAGTGAQLDNDDLVPGNTEAGVTVACATSGTYTVVVTSFQPGEAGAFVLTIR